MVFTLPKLPYSYNALEPFIDAQTMELHYTKHHQAYITNLNLVVQKNPDLQNKSVESLLSNLSAILDDGVKTIVRNHGGGHANHTLFWMTMMQPSSMMIQVPVGKLATMIEKKYQSFDNMKDILSSKATAIFGSGWAWLCCDQQNQLEIIVTSNQDSPLIQGLQPLLGLDVWEHAYYLKYQNKRADYIAAWWNVVNWNYVADRYEMLFINKNGIDV